MSVKKVELVKKQKYEQKEFMADNLGDDIKNPDF